MKFTPTYILHLPILSLHPKGFPQFAIVEYEEKKSAQVCLNYAHPHMVNSHKLLVKERAYKKLAEEPYFPWQKQGEGNASAQNKKGGKKKKNKEPSQFMGYVFDPLVSKQATPQPVCIIRNSINL